MCICSWDWVETYKVQLSNDSINWVTCKNGTQDMVRRAFGFVSDLLELVDGNPPRNRLLRRTLKSLFRYLKGSQESLTDA